MRKKNFIPIYLVFLLIILLAAACNLPTAMEGQVPTDTEEAPPATLPDQQETTQPEAEETEQPPQDEPAPTETQSLPTETVAHSTYPGQARCVCLAHRYFLKGLWAGWLHSGRLVFHSVL